MAVDQAAQEGLGGFLVAPLLHQDVEHQTILVHGAPQPIAAAAALEWHLVDVPLVSWPGAAPPHPVSEDRPELLAPPADRLVADGDPALRQQLLHVPVAQREAVVQPHGVADELTREPVPLVVGRGLLHRRVLQRAPAAPPPS